MKRLIAMICLMALSAGAQNFGFTPQQLGFLDARYGSAVSALTTNTIFGALGNVHGTYKTLSYTETDFIFTNWLAAFSATNTPGLTTDNTTTTNDGTRISVKNYDTNAIARTIYLRNARDSWNDYAESHINATTWNEATNNGVLAVTWAQLTGP